VDRRRFLLASLAGVLAAPLAAEAGKVYRVGILSPEVPPPGFLDAFREGLRDFGHVEGQNISLDLRDARGANERLPDLARELVALNVDVIVVINTPAARAAKAATATIPIVMNRVSDPVKAGLVSSLARPGGNLTGLSFSAVEVAPKQLQLLKEMLPRTSRIGLFWYAGNAAATVGIDGIESAATRMRLQSLRFPVQHPDDFGKALKAAARSLVEAVVVFEDIWLTKHRNEIATLAATNALPVVSLYRDFAEAGGLFAYGASPAAVYRRTAYYVDRILKGARPQDLPVEQPTRFDFVVNLKTAKALGLTIPPALLARAV
jgi:ABC-type uncharacterized transport system substrate-binding protein